MVTLSQMSRRHGDLSQVRPGFVTAYVNEEGRSHYPFRPHSTSVQVTPRASVENNDFSIVFLWGRGGGIRNVDTNCAVREAGGGGTPSNENKLVSFSR